MDGTSTEEEYCGRCQNKGRPAPIGCISCKKIGNDLRGLPPTGIKRRRVDFSSRFKKKKHVLDKRELELLEKLKSEIDCLWNQANIAKWNENRREYMELIAEIKKKERRLHST